VAGAEPLFRLQQVAVKESRLGIPLLFAMDVVHRYRTIFPVPLALAATKSGGVVSGRRESHSRPRKPEVEPDGQGEHQTARNVLRLG
jgi:Glycosyl hydrolase family 3 N terminal domain